MNLDEVTPSEGSKGQREIQWTGDNIMDVHAFMYPQEPIYMGRQFSNADEIVGVAAPSGLEVARISDYIVRDSDGRLFVRSVNKSPASACARCEQLQRRVKAFQEGYRDKAFEVTMQEIQIMDLRAHGIDKVTARQNESLKTKMLAACIERNEAHEALRGLLRGHKCWCSTWVGGEHEPECEAARAALGPTNK